MKYRAAVGILILGIVLAYEAALLTRIMQVGEVEEPPCRDCAQLYSALQSPLVEISELNNKRQLYEGKVVRVRATLYNDAGLVHLEDLASDGGVILAAFSPSCQSCLGAKKALSIYSGFDTWYDGAARVVVVGRVLRENPMLSAYNNGFQIECIESVEPVSASGYQRINYAIWQVVKAVAQHFGV